MSKATQIPVIQTNLYRINQIIWEGLDWLFPPVCAGCGKTHYRFCPDCVQTTPKPLPENCVLCGKLIHSGSRSHSCSRQTYIDHALVWGLHSGPLRKALHQFKYRRDLGLADVFSQYLISIFTKAQVNVDLIVPVPLARQRYRERGYNQAALLALAFSGRTGIRCRQKASKRIRETKSQVGLTIEQRRENVAGAFWANSSMVSGQRILLVDDVLTTGATLNACAQALKQAGAAFVLALTLARAP